MYETTKATMRRLHDSRFSNRYFVGSGIDVGAGNDSLSNLVGLFPRIKYVASWDVINGDAQYLLGVRDESYDFVHSSHCLEHMHDPKEALLNWFRVLKVGGYLICIVPDEDLYEQGTFPSTFNSDHKWTFTLHKESSWCEKSINLFKLIPTLGAAARMIKVELLDATYNYNAYRVDQTLTLLGESAIEFIIQKVT
jgi:predicted SAM-dependent methyltransferase